MRNYILASGIVFLLIVIAHIARIFAEGVRLLKEPSFVFTSLLTVALAGWAWRVYRQLARNKDGR